MMMPRNGFVNLKNPEIRNFFRLKKEFVKFLSDNGYRLYVDFDADMAFICDSEGNDSDHMTFKQLAGRTTVK